MKNDMDKEKRQTIEYKFLRQTTQHAVPKLRFTFSVYLTIFQIAFIILMAFFANYKQEPKVSQNGNGSSSNSNLYSKFIDVNSMIFIGFGLLMSFLKRYGYGSVGLSFLLAAYVIEWAILVKGWLISGFQGSGTFSLNINSLLIADYTAVAVLISFGAIIGKASLSQLVIMATIEVVIQSVNEFIGVNFLQAYDVGKSIYVHVFAAFFGLAISRVLHGNKEIESIKENSHYHSDLFSMIGTIFLWLYWPSLNSALAREEGQMRAVMNTYLALTSSCIATFIVSLFVGKGRLNIMHIQNATLAGGVAVGALADMAIEPYSAMVLGTIAGVFSTLGFQFLTPILNQSFVHDTCGVNNLHAIPGLISGIASAVIAASATREKFNGNRLYVFYPARTPMTNSTEYQENNLAFTEFSRGGLGRTAVMQGGYQIAALAMTLGFALVGGILTGYLMRIPIVEQIDNIEEMFDDEPNWLTPEDYSLKLSEVKVEHDGEEMEEKRV